MRKYRNIKEEKVLNSHVTNAFGIQWILEVNIEQRTGFTIEDENNENPITFNCICIYLKMRENR